jgi:hypothetical protein
MACLGALMKVFAQLLASKRARPRRFAVATSIAAVLFLCVIAGFAAGDPDSQMGDAVEPSTVADPQIQASARRSIEAAGEEEASRNTDTARAERDASRDAYRDLSASEALQTDKRELPEVLNDPAFAPFVPDPGAHIERYHDDDTAALVQAASGEKVLAESDAPLRGTTASGDRAPIDLTLHHSGGQLVPESAVVRASLPTQLADGITLPTDAGTLTIKPGAANVDSARADDDKLLYPNAQTDADVLAASVPTGIEFSNVVRSPAAPETFDYVFGGLPDGAQLRPASDGHAAEIVDGDQRLVAIHPPMATGADGQPLPVSLSVAGDRIELTVRHRDRDVAYPLVIDPVIETFNWYDAPSTDFNRWAYTFGPGPSSPAGHASGLTPQYTSIFGAGLFVKTNGAYLYNQDDGIYRFSAPGDAYVYRADFNLQNWNNSTTGGLMCTNAGIYNVAGAALDSQFYVNCNNFTNFSWGTCVSGTYPNCNAGAGTGGNAAQTDFWAWNGGQRPPFNGWDQGAESYTRRATIYLNDRVAPTLAWNQGSSPPTTWTNSTGSYTLNARDGGLGLKTASLSSSAGGWTGPTISTGCTGTRFDWAVVPPATKPKCDNDTHGLTFSLGDLPEGIQTLTASGTDALSQPGAATYALKLDRSEPTVNTAGALDRAEWSQRLASDHPDIEVNAIDDPTDTETTSGVSSIEVQIDGADPSTAHPFISNNTFSQGGPCDSCALDHVFQLDTSSYSNGDHTADVWVSDFAGNQVHETWSFTIDRAAAKPYCSDTSADLDDCQPDSPQTTPPACLASPTQTPSSGTLVAASAARDTTLATNSSAIAASDTTAIENLQVAPALNSLPQPLVGYTSNSTMVSANLGASTPTLTVGSSDKYACVTPVTLMNGATSPLLVAGTALEYANTAPSTDTILRPTPSGVQELQQLREPAAPQTQDYQVALQGVQRLQQLDDGSIAVVDPSLPATTDTAPPAGTSTTTDTPGETPLDVVPGAHDDPAAPADYQRGDLEGQTPQDIDLAPSSTEFQWESEYREFEQAAADTADQAIAVITPPTARDRNDAAVPTTLSLTGTGSFRVTTQHVGGGFSYPILTSTKVAAARPHRKNRPTYGWSGGYSANFSANNSTDLSDPNTDGTDRIRRKLKMPYRTAGNPKTAPPTGRHVFLRHNACDDYDKTLDDPNNPVQPPNPEQLPNPGPDATAAEKDKHDKCKESARTIRQILDENLTPYVSVEPDSSTFCHASGMAKVRQYARSIWRLERYAVFKNVKFWAPTNEPDHQGGPPDNRCSAPKVSYRFAVNVWERLKQMNRTQGGCPPAPDVPSHPSRCFIIGGEFSNDTTYAVGSTTASGPYVHDYLDLMHRRGDEVPAFALHDYYDVIFSNTARYFPNPKNAPSQQFAQERHFVRAVRGLFPSARVWMSEQGVLLTQKGQPLQANRQLQRDAAKRFLALGRDNPRINLVLYYSFFGCSQDETKRRFCNTDFDSGLVRNPPDPPNPEFDPPPYDFHGPSQLRAAYCVLAKRSEDKCYQNSGL